MHKLIKLKTYEIENGPHFNEEYARKAVKHMENEDGTKGQHWSVEEAVQLANQYGVRIGQTINKYDWYVALNMIYSDYYRFIINTTGSNNSKHFVELAKAWINDKDIDEGKMWYYFMYVMCDEVRDELEEYCNQYEEEDSYPIRKRANYRAINKPTYRYDNDYDDYEDDEYDYDNYRMKAMSNNSPKRFRSVRYVRY